MKQIIQFIRKYFSKPFSADFSDAINKGIRELSKEMGMTKKAVNNHND